MPCLLLWFLHPVLIPPTLHSLNIKYYDKLTVKVLVVCRFRTRTCILARSGFFVVVLKITLICIHQDSVPYQIYVIVGLTVCFQGGLRECLVE